MEVITNLIIIVFGILQIILFFKLWGMTNNIKKILKIQQKEHKDLEIQKKMEASMNKFKKGDSVTIQGTDINGTIDFVKDGKYLLHGETRCFTEDELEKLN